MNMEKGMDKIVKTLRVMITDQPGYLGLTTAIGAEGGNIGDIWLISSGITHNITVDIYGTNHYFEIIVKGSSYRPHKRPTRIPSIRSKDPGPGHKHANKTFIQASCRG